LYINNSDFISDARAAEIFRSFKEVEWRWKTCVPAVYLLPPDHYAVGRCEQNRFFQTAADVYVFVRENDRDADLVSTFVHELAHAIQCRQSVVINHSLVFFLMLVGMQEDRNAVLIEEPEDRVLDELCHQKGWPRGLVREFIVDQSEQLSRRRHYLHLYNNAVSIAAQFERSFTCNKNHRSTNSLNNKKRSQKSWLRLLLS